MTRASASLLIGHIGLATMPPILDPFGGAIQRRVWELARHQVRRGHRVVVYSVGRQRERRVVEDVTIEYFPISLPLPLGQVEFQLRAFTHARRTVGSLDLLHVHSQPEAAVLASGLARCVMFSFDNYFFRGGRGTPLFRAYRRALLAFDLLLPVSEYCRDSAAEYWDLSPSRLQVLFNGVDLEQFAPDDDAARTERARIPGEDPVVLYVGRVNHQKGTDVLIDAVRRLRQSGARFHMVIAGPLGQFGGESADNLWLKAMSEVGITYLGAVTDERLRGIYNMAEVFVMPTTTLEMFGMAVVEAQACGRPVVCTDHGGLPETVPSTAGIRVPPGSPADLAAAIALLLREPAHRQRLADGAIQNAKRFSWSGICERIEMLHSTATRR